MASIDRREELIAQYAKIHAEKDYGHSSEIMIGIVQKHIYDLPEVKTILDFGCGRSRLVDWLAKIHDATPYRYDPAIPEFAEMPVDKVDLVICTDVMEHISDADIKPVIRQIKGLSDNAFFNISCREADEILPNGENAHCSVHPHAWWMSRLRGQFPNVARTRAFSSDDLSAFTWGKSS